MTLTTPSDVTILQALADPDRYRILLHLLKNPATQKQLATALSINSGTISKHMKVLSSAELAHKGRSHSAYELRFEERLRNLLREVSNLKLEILDEKRATAAEELEELTRAGIELVEPETGRGAG
ncbi:MAG: Bacterial regulatory protein arsR family [Alphaproteobacteria bacterium]|jgi:DNA-binding transcriptional ArsR family regulator|nr:Bacterial regulatory protein arsR family [Alphaproteobacteria bacterium]